MARCLLLLNGIVHDNIQSVIDCHYRHLSSSGYDVTCLISTWKSCEHKCITGSMKFLHEDVDYEYLDKIGFPYSQQLLSNPQWQSLRLGHYANFVNVAKTLSSIDISSYDCIAKSRTDLFLDFIPPDTLLQGNIYTFPTFWGGQMNNNMFMNDHYLLGTIKDMVEVYSGVSSMIQEFSSMWNPEMYMRYLTIKAEKSICIMTAKKYYIKKGINENIHWSI